MLQRPCESERSGHAFAEMSTIINPPMPNLHALELFAGIGGNSYAFKAAGIKTIGYCEIDPWAQAVLRSNMLRGRLHRAPIFPDVATLRCSQFSKKPDIISGGFPCLGLSLIGTKQGLLGDERSKLILHVCRLVEEATPQYVFLENTPAIIRDNDYQGLLDRLLKLGYSCAFFVSTASQQGAAQTRARWFLLARRVDAAPLKIRTSAIEKLREFFVQSIDTKTAPRDNGRASATCSAFGNSGVPAQALSALHTLNEALAVLGAQEFTPTTLARLNKMKPVVTRKSGELQQWRAFSPLPTACAGEGFNVVPPKVSASERMFGGTAPKRASLSKEFFRRCMPTARTRPNCAAPGLGMTTRSMHDPGNFLLSSREMYASGEVPPTHERRKLSVSDTFWAVHFGFPADWISEPLASIQKSGPRALPKALL